MDSSKQIDSQDILELVKEKQLANLLRNAKSQLEQEKLTAEVEAATDQIIEETCQKLKTVTLAPEAQQEISGLLDQMLYLRKMSNLYLIRMARNAIALLIDSVPQETGSTAKRYNLIVAKRIRRQIRYEIFVHDSQSTMLILGLAGFISIFAIGPFLIYLLIQGTAPMLKLEAQNNGRIGMQTDRALTLQLPTGEERNIEANTIYSLVLQASNKAEAASPDAPTQLPGAAQSLPNDRGPETSALPSLPSDDAAGLSPEDLGTTSGDRLPSQQAPTVPPEAPADALIVVPESRENFLRNTGSFFENVGINLSLLLIVVIGGAIGSSISVIVRAQNVVKERRAEPLSLFFTGLLKPIVGIAFALFMFAALESGLVSVGNREQTNRTYLYLAIAFVAGFSERFVQDILIKTEQSILPASRREDESEG